MLILPCVGGSLVCPEECEGSLSMQVCMPMQLPRHLAGILLHSVRVRGKGTFVAIGNYM